MNVYFVSILPDCRMITDGISLVQYTSSASFYGRCRITLSRSNARSYSHDDRYSSWFYRYEWDIHTRDTLCDHPDALEEIQKWEKSI